MTQSARSAGHNDGISAGLRALHLARRAAATAVASSSPARDKQRSPAGTMPSREETVRVWLLARAFASLTFRTAASAGSATQKAKKTPELAGLSGEEICRAGGGIDRHNHRNCTVIRESRSSE